MQEMQGFDPWVGKMPWGRAWQPTAVFLPGETHGQRSLAGCSPGVTEWNATEATWHTHLGFREVEGLTQGSITNWKQMQNLKATSHLA